MKFKFISICFCISKMFVPLTKRITGSNQRTHSQIPRHRGILMRRRRCLKEQLLKARSEAWHNSIMAKLIDIELKIQDSLRHQSEYEESKTIESIKQNPKVRIGVGPLIDVNNQVIDCPKNMTGALSAQYQCL